MIQDNEAARGRRGYADVVMKGGVASGVVYPNAIFEIARYYDLKNIGGTSVGAIAASIAAAAELRRRNGSDLGYLALSQLPDFLAREGTLRALFAADRGAKPLLELALCMTGNASFWLTKLPAIALRSLRYFWWITAVVLLCFAGVTWANERYVIDGRPLFEFAAVIAAVLAWVVMTVITLAIRCIGVLDRGDFGWCHGHSALAQQSLKLRLARERDITTLTAKETPPLTDWLDAFVGFVAEREPNNPVTFGDLWNAPYPGWDSPHGPRSEKSIDFAMVTTCLTLGRPFAVPFNPDEIVGRKCDPDTETDQQGNRRPPLYFREDRLRRFFGPNLIKHLIAHGAVTSLDTSRKYYRLPAAQQMPIVVAARLSMSFPVLFSAVPLFAPDDNGRMQEVWFSDGGLSSNFPIYMFDAPTPGWPTFCIDLLGGDTNPATGLPKHKRVFDQTNQPGMPPFLESDVPIGTINPWNKLSRGFARGNVLAFASSMIDAMRTWQDTRLGMLPGNASRTVGIRLPSNEGGVNLMMPPNLVKDMDKRGQAAGSLLVTRFDPSAATGWQDHRWIRYRATMYAIDAWLDEFDRSWHVVPAQPNQQSYSWMAQNYARRQSGGSFKLKPTSALVKRKRCKRRPCRNSVTRSGEKGLERNCGT